MHTFQISQFTYHRPLNGEPGKLSAEMSELQHGMAPLKMQMILRGVVFHIQGQNELRAYKLARVEREQAHNEIGDVQAWVFERFDKDRAGNTMPGHILTVFND